MEVASSEKRGSMKGKLIMSFYRAAKPPASSATATVKPRPASLVRTTSSFRNDEGNFGKSYVHGPNGGGGDDELVDNKATSYISYVKERIRLEESILIKGKNSST